ncbi:hypothetical protein [Serratia sp. UGAL515B_01]|nr:hypothetical protein [Serratia sp. UGAL515B_01]WON76170.1 hypothetical protein OK023_13105 [Serratia sp. UGAL515B_01]
MNCLWRSFETEKHSLSLAAYHPPRFSYPLQVSWRGNLGASLPYQR